MSEGSDRSDPSSDECGNFDQHAQIDTSRLIGDAVGNMSISPTSRDIVLATRRGLYIIDLHEPHALPRFLAQGGTWDCADVQWHRSRGEYIISTSGEKLLIWNLMLSGRSSIEHVLQAHYRSITDINWSPRDPSMVASTGLDSWLWLWDMRSLAKPALGLCAFEGGGTQVKWNRQDDHILASAHGNDIFIWDTRKGSLPISRITAHSARVYGIDWKLASRTELITCSLDKTIKVWDTQQTAAQPGAEAYTDQACKLVYRLPYPVWRARDLPFGRGILSLPQRGEHALEMYAYDAPTDAPPVERFEGHADTVKEFVWRRGCSGHDRFQLITLSKDRTLRFWPVETDTMQRVGHQPSNSSHTSPPVKSKSYRDPPVDQIPYPTGMVSIPLGPHMAIFDQVRVGPQPGEQRPRAPRTGAPGSKARAPPKTPASAASTPSRAGMTRGARPGRPAPLDQLQWLKSIRREGAREGSASGTDSGSGSRYASRSRGPSRGATSGSRERERSESGPRADVLKEGEDGLTWQDEVTNALTALTPYKVKLEKLDAKRRTCSVTLQGPWGASSTNVFVRVAFEFPKAYRSVPSATPEVELDKSPLIAPAARVAMLAALDDIIREGGPLCVHSCLSFLRFGSTERRRPPSPGLASSSDEEDAAADAARRGKVARIMRHQKNLGEPRTSQGVFAPNGQLVCFFRPTPRIVRHVLADDAQTSSAVSVRPSENAPASTQPSALVLAGAIQHLVQASRDRPATPLLAKRGEDAHNILRIMSNLLGFMPTERARSTSRGTGKADDAAAYHLMSLRRSAVSVRDATPVLGLNRQLALEYVYGATGDMAVMHRKNAVVAHKHGYLHHARVFGILEAMTRKRQRETGELSPLSVQLLTKMYNTFLETRDQQMLAMLALALLSLYQKIPTPQTAPTSAPKSTGSVDYFSRREKSRGLSPGWPPLTPTASSPTPTQHTNTPGKGSWSSLFQSTLHHRHSREGPHPNPPSAETRRHGSSPNSPTGIPVPGRTRPHRVSDPARVQPAKAAIPASWTQMRTPPLRTPISFSSAGHGWKKAARQKTTPTLIVEKTISVIQFPESDSSLHPYVTLETNRISQLVQHAHAFAEILYSWEAFLKRAELLKTLHDVTKHQGSTSASAEHSIGVQPNPSGSPASRIPPYPVCGFCRLPIRGLSMMCVDCQHVIHMRCWRSRSSDLCPSGCGCHCRVDSRVDIEARIGSTASLNSSFVA